MKRRARATSDEDSSGIRPYWRGHLRLALVSCPIRLIPALTDQDKVRFHKLNRETGNRLHQQMVDYDTGDVVERDETVMGYELEQRPIRHGRDGARSTRLRSRARTIIDHRAGGPRHGVDCLSRHALLVEPDCKSGLDVFATIRDAIARRSWSASAAPVIARRERAVRCRRAARGCSSPPFATPTRCASRGSFKRFRTSRSTRESVHGRDADRADEREIRPAMFDDRYQDALRALVEARTRARSVTAPKVPGGRRTSSICSMR